MSTAFTLEGSIELNISGFDSSLNEAQSKTSTFADMLKANLVTQGIGVAVNAFKELGSAAVGFAKDAVNTGMQFDQAMSQVAATMGYSMDELNTEGSEAAQTLQTLTDFAIEMGSTTAFTATEASEALNYMALAGYDANTSMEMLPNVLNLAAAGAIDLGYASDMVTDTQSALGLSIEETAAMVDQMAAAASKSNTSVSQLGEAMLTIGATAANVRGGTQELATVLGVLADNGIKGSEGGTHLRNILLSLQQAAEDGSVNFGDFNVELYDADGNMRSLIDVVADMQDGMAGMTQESKDALISGIFNKTDLASVNALLNTSTQRFEELGAAIADSAGAAEEMANVQLDNLAGDITIFQSALDGAKIAISNRLTPTLREFVQFGTSGVSRLTTAFQEEGLAGAATAFGDILADGVQMLTNMLPDVIEAGKNIVSSLISGIVAGLPSFMSMLPDFLSAFVDLLTSVVTGIIEALPDMIRSLAQAIPKMLNVLLEALPDLITGILSALPEIVTSIIEELPSMLANIGEAIITNFPIIIAAIAQGLAEAALSIFTWIRNLFTDVDEQIDEVSQSLQEKSASVVSFADMFSAAVPQIADFNTILSSSGSTLSELEAAIDEKESAITEIIRTSLQEQGELRAEDIQNIESYLEEINRLEEEKMEIYRTQQIAQLRKLQLESGEITAETAAQHLANTQAALDAANEATENSYTARIQTIENKYTAMGDIGSEAYQRELEEAKEWHDQQIAENQSYYDEALGLLNDNVDDMVAADADRWAQISSAASKFSQENMSSIEKWLNNVGLTMSSSYQEWLLTYGNALNDMDLDAANHFISSLAIYKAGGQELTQESKDTAANILGAFDNLPEDMDEVGKNALLGIINGIDAQIPELKNTSGMTADEIVDVIKEFLGIHSPSTVLQEVGVNAIEGMILGIEKQVTMLVSTVQDAMQHMYKGMIFIVDSLTELGGQMAIGVADGFAANSSYMYSVVTGIMSNLVARAKSQLQIHSPSRVFAGIGEMISAGLGEGIEDGSDSAIDAMEDLNSQLISVTDARGNKRTMTSAQATGELVSLLNQYLPQLANMGIYLDGDTLVGNTVDRMSEAMGNKEIQADRGVVYA